MRTSPAPILVIGLLWVASCAQGDSSPAQAAAKPYTVLDDQASQLRADFNRKVGTVRLLFVVDPICPTCLRGLDDMNRDLLEGTADARRKPLWFTNPSWARRERRRGREWR
jgi:hypothetical protein